MMAGGNPNQWKSMMMNSIHPLYQQGSAYLSPQSSFPYEFISASSPLPSSVLSDSQHNHDIPQCSSWNKLLPGRLATEEERFSASLFQNKSENWQDGQLLKPSLRVPAAIDVNQDVTQISQTYGHHQLKEIRACKPCCSSQLIPSSSSVTYSNCSNLVDLSMNGSDGICSNQQLDHSVQCNSTAIGWVPKKPRAQFSSAQQPPKVKKEKLGGRISALHRLVSPFGKTDTASVLLEAIRCIRFLQAQVETLTSLYLDNASGSMRYQQMVQGAKNCTNPKEPFSQEKQGDGRKDYLKSRGLCLVPVSCTHYAVFENYYFGPDDYCAPPSFGGGF